MEPSWNPAAGDLFPGSLVASVACAAWAWLIAALLGAALLPLSGDRGRWRILCWVVVGVAAETTVWLGLSLVHRLLPPYVLLTACVLTLACGIVGGRRLLAAWRDPEPVAAGPGARSIEVVAGGLVVALLAIVARFALWPTVFYDDLVYHVAAPRQALLTGTWPALSGMHYSFMPAGWDAMYVLPLALGGGSGPQILNTIGLALLAWAAARLGRLGGERPAARAAAALFVVAPVTLSLGALAGNDLFVALAIAVAAERLAATLGARPVLVGLLAGAAWAAKYTALAASVGLGAAAAVLATGGLARRAGRMMQIGVVTVLVALPWTVRCIVLTGSPLYPAFYGLFGGRYWDPRSAALVAEQVSHGGLENRGPAAFVLAAWDLLTRSADLGFPAGINPVFLVIALLGMWRMRRVAGGAGLLVAMLVAYVGWCVTSLNVRYGLGMLALLVPFAAAAVQVVLDVLARRGRPVVASALVAGVLALAALGPLVDGTRRHLNYYGDQTTLFGGTPRADIQANRIHLAELGREAASRLPRDARILLVGDGRIGLLPRPALASSAYDRPDIARFVAGAKSVAEINERLRGFTHVVVSFRELERFEKEYRYAEWFGPGEYALFQRWLATGLRPVARRGTVALYEVRYDADASAGDGSPRLPEAE